MSSKFKKGDRVIGTDASEWFFDVEGSIVEYAGDSGFLVKFDGEGRGWNHFEHGDNCWWTFADEVSHVTETVNAIDFDDVDVEIKVLAAAVAAFESVEDEGIRQRVFNYLSERYDLYN